MSPKVRGYSPDTKVDPLELRQAARVGTDLAVQIFSRDWAGPLPGRTRDLSVSGACIATPSPFALKSLTSIVIQLPDRPLALACEGRWQREEPADDLVLTGLSFCELTGDQLDVLWSTVLDQGKDLARFLFDRTPLRELGLEEAMTLAQVTRYRDIPAGHSIYRQNTRNAGEDSVFLLMHGAVVLTVRVRNARELELARLRPGAVFGGLPLLADEEHAESAAAATDVRLLEIDASAFRYIRVAKPWMGYRLGMALVRVCMQRAREILRLVQDHA
jgi:hypothetical protein